VRHSQRANDLPVHSWVTCEDDGVVDSGHCTCMAGLGEVCSHVAAILFYLESASRATKSCTQTDCRWKEPRLVETIPYSRIMDIPFTKPKGLVTTNRKRGAHLYSNSVPLSGLPQCSQPLQSSTEVDPSNSQTSIDEPEVSISDSVETQSEVLEPSNQIKGSADFSFSQLLHNPQKSCSI